MCDVLIDMRKKYIIIHSSAIIIARVPSSSGFKIV